MSDNDSDNAQPKIGYIAEYDRRGAASCKKCKQRLVKGQVRLGKAAPNPFSDKPEDTMKSWFHVQCMFDTLQRARATTKKIESVADLEGFEKLAREDQKSIEQHIKAFNEAQGKRKGAKGAKAAASPQKTSDAKAARNVSTPAKPAAKNTSAAPADDAKLEEELSFRTYRKLCADMADESGYIAKSRILSEFLKRGLSGAGFRGDLRVLLGLFLPQEVAAVYNLKDKQLVKLFGLLFQADQDAMLADLSAGGDVSETIRKFFESSSGVRPAAHSTLSQKDVADWLAKLTELTKADDQRAHLGVIARRSTSNDLKMIVRLIKKDIRINAGAKHVLDALDPSAHESYSALQDLDAVVARFVSKDAAGNSKTKMAVGSELMKPVSPMLAAQCRSAVEALQHAPGGLFAEVKYDGERVQLHKRGNSFLYFSRNLKPVVPHKVVELQPFIADAFPGVNDIILDSEVLVVDTRTGKPLPFGTLGVHKKNSAGEHASTCIFVFDILHLNGVDLMRKPLLERKRILKETLKEVKNRIMIAEYEVVTKREQLEASLVRVFKENLEGLVLKDANSLYEPGKRHWLKMKRDYLGEGSMADTADLIVLGAYSGTGQKGGLMSTFLMGSYDSKSGKFCTVSKVGNGLDLQTLHTLQSQLQVVPIQKDAKRVPSWLNVSRSLVPEFVVKDPKAAPVWEITGAEFSKSSTHTAGGISIRFPRVTRFRDDKSWREATDVARLAELFEASKKACDVRIEQLVKESSANASSASPRRRKPALSSPSSSKFSSPTQRDSPSQCNSSSSESPSAINTPTKSPKKQDDAVTPRSLHTPTRSSSPPATVPKRPANSKVQSKKRKRPIASDDEQDESEDEESEESEEDDDSEEEEQTWKSDGDDSEQDGKRSGKGKRKPWLTAPDRNYSPSVSPSAKRARTSLSTRANTSSSRAEVFALPDFFSGLRFDLSQIHFDKDNEMNLHQLQTRIVAYDGEVCSASDVASATHVVLGSDSPANSDKASHAKPVTLKWLLDCIRQQKLL